MADGRQMVEALRALASHSADNTVLESLEKGQFRAVFGPIGINRNLNGQSLDMAQAKQLVENGNAAIAAGEFPPLRLRKGAVKTKMDVHAHGDSEHIVGLISKFAIGKDRNGTDAVVFVGQCYDTTEHARHAAQLVKAKQYKFGSWEVEAASMQCSTCGKVISNYADLCPHVRVVTGSGGKFLVAKTRGTQLAMHNPKPSGWVLIEKADTGATPETEILEVAAARLAQTENQEEPMADKKQQAPAEDTGQVEAQAAKATDVKALEDRIAELEAENKTLTATNAELTEKVDGFEATAKESRIDALLADMKERGMNIEDDAKEKERLSGLDEAVLAAEEGIVSKLPIPAAAAADEGEGEAPKAAAANLATASPEKLAARASQVSPQNVATDGGEKTKAQQTLDKYKAAARGESEE